MRLADAGRAEEDDVLGALDEGEAGELVVSTGTEVSAEVGT
jgi:hypothetical protein